MNYSMVAQSAAEVSEPGNSPATTMWPHLLETKQAGLLNQISVYAEPGATREQVRLLYMNATALRMWRELGHRPVVVGEMHRPPRTALLTFGMPFAE